MNKLEYAIQLILDNEDTLWYYENGHKYLVIEINDGMIVCYNPAGEIFLDIKDTYKIEEDIFGNSYNLVKKKTPKKIRRLR